MALTVTVNTSKSPVELTITSDKRITPTIRGTVESAGETANWEAVFPFKPIVVKNEAGVVIATTTRTDIGTVAVVAI